MRRQWIQVEIGEDDRPYMTGDAVMNADLSVLKAIPADEPVFVLRGQDALTVRTIQAYRERCVLGAYDASTDEDREALMQQAEGALLAQREMTDWQQDNAGRVKLPDHVHRSLHG